MSNRRKKSAIITKFVSYTAAILIHLVIIGLMVFKFTSKSDVIEAVDADEISDVVRATTVDETQIQQLQEEIRHKDAETKRREENERKRLAELKKQAELENDRIDELKEKQKLEQEKALELEEQRKEIAEKRKQEQEQREQEKAQIEKERLAEQKKAAELKKRQEAERVKQAKIAEQKKKEEEAERVKQAELAEQKKKADEAARAEQAKIDAEKQQAQQAFIDQLEAEEAKRRTTTLTKKYAALVIKSINAKRTIAPDFTSSLVAKLNIKLSPRGDVLSVSVVESSGNPRYDRDAEKAVRNASPLPIPSAEEDEAAHKTFQDLTLNIRMPGA